MNTDEFQETTTDFNNLKADLDSTVQGCKVPRNLTSTNDNTRPDSEWLF